MPHYGVGAVSACLLIASPSSLCVCRSWPSPVLLTKLEDILKDVPEGLELPYWDPRYNPSDRNHIMPIITPAYPPQNSTFNVTQSNLKIIQKEVELGVCVCVRACARACVCACACVCVRACMHACVSVHTLKAHTGCCA